jgi:hypothetical protein
LEFVGSRSISREQAPLAIQARQESVAALQNIEHLRLVGSRACPTAATSKYAVFLREIGNTAEIHYAMKGDYSLLPRVVEKVIEKVLRKFWFPANLHYLADGSPFHIIDVPANNVPAVVANDNPAESSSFRLSAHEI